MTPPYAEWIARHLTEAYGWRHFDRQQSCTLERAVPGYLVTIRLLDEFSEGAKVDLLAWDCELVSTVEFP